MIEISLQVAEDDAPKGQCLWHRIDLYLAQQLSDLSRSRIQQLIEQGHVQVNGQVCISKKASVQPGDRISLQIPEAQPLDLQPENIPWTSFTKMTRC